MLPWAVWGYPGLSGAARSCLGTVWSLSGDCLGAVWELPGSVWGCLETVWGCSGAALLLSWGICVEGFIRLGSIFQKHDATRQNKARQNKTRHDDMKTLSKIRPRSAPQLLHQPRGERSSDHRVDHVTLVTTLSRKRFSTGLVEHFVLLFC